MRTIFRRFGGLAFMVAALVGDGAASAEEHSLPGRRAAQPTRGPACATDNLVHAETSAGATASAQAGVHVQLPGARTRDVARLTLPCGFHVDSRYGFNLVLTDGKEFRVYRENNAFGFAPAFGFSERTSPPYTLTFQVVAQDALHADSCIERLAGYTPALQLCGSFGSDVSFFGASGGGTGAKVAHYTATGSQLSKDFAVADIDGRLVSLSFLPPPDAPGGTVTLIYSIDGALYRAYLDVPRG